MPAGFPLFFSGKRKYKNDEQKIKISLGQRLFNLLTITFMMIIMVIMIYPMWHILMASFSDSNELIKNLPHYFLSLFLHPPRDGTALAS